MTRLKICLLGSFEASLGDDLLIGFESATAQALLARLAAEPGQEVPRPVLAEMLWPERPEGRALGNLRHTLAVLRRTIGDHEAERPVLRTSAAGLAVDPTADVVIDVAELGRFADTSPSAPAAVADWESGIGLHRGPFLEGFDARLSAEWDTWLLTTRAQLDERVASLHQRLAELRRRTGELDRAEEHARRWLELDPWNEQGHQALIEILALDDRVAAAVSHAGSFAAALSDELGLQPSSATQRLVDEIRAGRFPLRPPGVPHLPSVPPTVRDAEPCVARAAELAWLHEHLDAALAGDGRLVFVEGAAGTGKSVLLRAFDAAARHRIPELTVARGASNGFAGMGDPYLPFRQILGQLCGDIDAAWRQGMLTPAEASHLWEAVPVAVEAVLDEGPALLHTLIDADALRNRFDSGYPDHLLSEALHRAIDQAAQRSQDPTRPQQPLLDQSVRVLRRLAATRPLLVLIDDLHWADAGTLELLLHLSGQLRGSPMLVVGAYRPPTLLGAGEGGDPLEMVVREARAHADADCILELTGSRDFVDAWLDREPNALDERFRAHLFRTTHGHALFTVEMVRAMRERGDLRQDAGGRWYAGDEVVWDDLPPRADASIAARLLGLPDELRRDLDVASVQGDSFVTEVVATVRGLPVADIVLRLSGVASPPHALVEYQGREGSDGGARRRYRFRHALFAQYLRDHLDPAQRTVLHEQTARALEVQYADRLDVAAGELATHFDEAGLVDEAIEYWARAGRRALALSTGEAIEHLRRALELLERLEPSSERDQRELGLLASLGIGLQAQAGYNAPATSEAYERIRTLLGRVAPGPEVVEALASLVTVDGLRARYAEAIVGARRLLDLAVAIEAPPIEAVAHMQLGWVLLMTGQLDDADHHLQLVAEQYDPSWDDRLTAAVGVHVPSTALAWRAVVAWHLGFPDTARARAASALSAAREAQFPFGLVFALAVAGCVVGELLEDGPAVAAASAELGDLAEREGFDFYRDAAAVLHRGTGRRFTGDLEGGIVDMQRGLAAWAGSDSGAFLTWEQTWLADALVEAGRLEEATAVLEEIEARLETGEEALAALRGSLVRGRLARATGDLAAAEADLGRALDVAREMGALGAELQAATALAQLLCDQSRLDEAQAVLAPVVGRFSEGAETADGKAAAVVLDRCRAV